MLAEYLNDSQAAAWTQVMPGARACLFSLREGTVSLPSGWSLCTSRRCSAWPGRSP